VPDAKQSICSTLVFLFQLAIKIAFLILMRTHLMFSTSDRAFIIYKYLHSLQ